MDQDVSRRPAAEESKSQLARLVSMFLAPGRTLAGLKHSPAIAAALTATALAGALQATALSRASDLDAMVRYSYEQQTERMPGSVARNLSDADHERAQEAMHRALTLSRNFAPVLGGLAGAAAPVAAAGFFLLVFGILGSPGGFRLVLSTVAHAGWPPALASSVLTTVVVRMSWPMPPERASEPLRTSLAGIADLEGAAAALASRVELFLAWELALTTIGFAAVLGISQRRSFAVALALWALVTAVAVGAALLSGLVNFGVRAA